MICSTADTGRGKAVGGSVGGVSESLADAVDLYAISLGPDPRRIGTSCSLHNLQNDLQTLVMFMILECPMNSLTRGSAWVCGNMQVRPASLNVCVEPTLMMLSKLPFHRVTFSIFLTVRSPCILAASHWEESCYQTAATTRIWDRK